MTTRRALACALAGLPILPWPARATGFLNDLPSLPHPESLLVELNRALAVRKALVLLVSLDGCPFCKLVRESYLVPLRGSGQPVVQIELARPLGLADVRGRLSTHALVSREFGVRLAPTVLFLGRGGVELASRLSGVASTDFYGAYLQDRVDAANRAANV